MPVSDPLNMPKTLRELVEDPEFRLLGKQEKEKILDGYRGYAGLTPREKIKFIDRYHDESYREQYGPIVGGGLDLGRDVIDSVASAAEDFVKRNSRSAAFLAQTPFSPLKSLERLKTDKQLQDDLTSSAIDAALFALPMGMVGRGAMGVTKALGGGALGKLAGQGVRAAGAGAKLSPIFANLETVADPAARVKEVALESAIEGTLPFAGKALSPVASAAQQLVKRGADAIPWVKAAEDVFEKSLKASSEAEASASFAQALRESLHPDGKSAKPLIELAGDWARGNEEIIERVVSKLDEGEKLGFASQKHMAEANFPKVVREDPQLRKMVSSPQDLPVSMATIKEVRHEMARFHGRFLAFANQAAKMSDSETARIIEDLVLDHKKLYKEYTAVRSSTGRHLNAFRVMSNDIFDVARRATKAAADSEKKLPLAQEIMRRVKEGEIMSVANAKDVMGLMTAQIFPLWSFARDIMTNMGAYGSEILQSLGKDAVNYAKTGDPFYRTKAIVDGFRYIRSDSTLPQSMRELLHPLTYSEKSRKVWVNSRWDDVLVAGAAAKRGTDQAFRRMAGMSYLYEAAYKKGISMGKKGADLKEFSRRYVVNADGSDIQKAIERANRVGWNRELSNSTEWFVRNLGVKGFLTPFPRWWAQFTRFAAEHSPLDPVFWKKVRQGEATSDDFTDFVIRNTQGMAGVRMVSETIYDYVDFSTMEYVDENNRRLKLTGFTPLPDALFLVALFRGDYPNAIQAGKSVSLFGVGGERGGLLSPLFELGKKGWGGEVSIDQWTKDLEGFAARFIPGRALLKSMAYALDPKLREGSLLKDLPVASSYAAPKIDPTTGEESEFKAGILGIEGLEGVASRLRGNPFIVRDVSKLQSEFFRLGYGYKRPGRTPVLDLDDGELDVLGGVGEDFQRRYEELAGEFVNETLGTVVDQDWWGGLSEERQKQIFQKYMRKAKKVARYQAYDEFGVRMPMVARMEMLLERKKPRVQVR